MIDPFDSALIPLRKAASLCPPGRNGRARHVSTLYRWALRGVRNVRLQTICVGGVRYTTPEALRAFCAEISRGESQTLKNSDDAVERERRVQIARAKTAAHGLRPRKNGPS